MNLPRVPSLRVVRRVVKLLLIEDLLLLQFVELDLLCFICNVEYAFAILQLYSASNFEVIVVQTNVSVGSRFRFLDHSVQRTPYPHETVIEQAHHR